MPLKGLTWARFKEHLRKSAAIYIVGIIVCVVLSNILYTSTRPQVPAEREVLIYLVNGYSNPDPLNDLCAQALTAMQAEDETLEEVHVESLMYTDPSQDYTSSYVLMTRMSVGDGDIYLTNRPGLEAMFNSGACYPLDELIGSGWMEGVDFEPYYHIDTEVDETTMELVEIPGAEPYVAALDLSSFTGLADLGVMESDGLYLVVASNGTNKETSVETIEYMLRQIAEGNYAPAASTEPEA